MLGADALRPLGTLNLAGEDFACPPLQRITAEFFEARLAQADKFGLRSHCILDPGTGFAPLKAIVHEVPQFKFFSHARRRGSSKLSQV